MEKRQTAGEALVQAWLDLSSVAWNKRLVSSMTFNETLVCNLLFQREQAGLEKPLTATELCKATRFLRSQMNQLIHMLEGKGYVQRQRSETDHRQMYIRLTEAGKQAYVQEHSMAMGLVNELEARLGTEKTEQAAQMVAEVAQCLRGILDQRPAE